MDEGIARIELRRKSGPSLWAVVDAADWDRVRVHRWHANVLPNTTYVRARIYINGKRETVSLHRFILGVSGEAWVDHQDGDGLNNRRSNLRIAEIRLNRANSRKTQNGKSSRYKGVSRCRQPGMWQVSLANVYLGRYPSEEEAAQVYDEAARAKYGEFACVNFPLDSSRPAA